MARHFFPWWMEDAYAGVAVAEDTLTDEELRLMREHRLSCAQIGFRRQLFADYRGLAKQEYAENADECFLASGECIFEKAAIDRRGTELSVPIEARRNGELLIWYPPVAGRSYLVAVDPAGGGTEGDYSAAQVMDVMMGLQCAELRCKASGYELALEVEKLAKEYNLALVVVERNNHGSGVLAYLTGVCRYPRLFEQNGQQGWLTSVLSRQVMIGALCATLLQTPQIFSSDRLLRECRTFVRHRNGKMAAQNGEHDDCLMAMAIALQVRGEVVLAR